MKKFLSLIGKPAFWLSLPLLYFYLGHTRRTRVLIMAEGKVLLVRGWFGDGKWTLSGGGLHRGEAIEDGAVREVREETGVVLDPKQLQHLVTKPYRHYGIPMTLEIFAAALPAVVQIRPENIEIIALEWVPLSDISNYRVANDVESTIKVWTGA